MRKIRAESMTELLTAAQMRAIEAAAIASAKVTGLELMERAGRGVVEAIYAQWPEFVPAWGPAPKPPEYLQQNDEEARRKALVLCGPGNNGGDGFVVARLLETHGWHVEVFLYGDAAKLPPDARVNYDRWVKIGTVDPLDDATGGAFQNCHLIVDAVFGTGLARPIKDFGHVLRDICDCVDAGGGQPLNDRLPHWPAVVAVDIPSGICADSGHALRDPYVKVSTAQAACAAADLTVTFHRAKRGHVLAEGPMHAGQLQVCDIGLGRSSPSSDLVRIAQGAPERKKARGHKYSHGHALVMAGGVGKGGAARLAARAALRVGAGAVTLVCPPAAMIENAAQLNAVMLQPVGDGVALRAILADERINALCIGPGLGLEDDKAELVAQAMESGRALVLDADALTLIAKDTGLSGLLHDNCVLTPHAGEFARLFPDIADKLTGIASAGPAYSKVDATRAAAARAGCTVLFKGPDTVVADQDGRCCVNASVYDRAAPWLATAGSGDVLAGLITGLLARGKPPLKAAETGAWLHTECALSFGPGLIAEDLPEELPKVLRNLGL